jgi:hypothetical protein
MLEVRVLADDDYDRYLIKWWKDWRFPAPPKDFLPGDGNGGIMICKDGLPIVAGFIYLTNSKVAWSEFIVSNFEVKDKILREEAILFCISELTRIAHECGAKYVYSVVKNQNLKKHYQKIGYQEGSQKVDEVVLII